MKSVFHKKQVGDLIKLTPSAKWSTYRVDKVTASGSYLCLCNIATGKELLDTVDNLARKFPKAEVPVHG